MALSMLRLFGQVTLDACKRCKILIGPCEGPVFLRNCEECTLTIATRNCRSQAAARASWDREHC